MCHVRTSTARVAIRWRLRPGRDETVRHRGGEGRRTVETLWDWLSILVFAGLIVLFLQRSSMDEPPDTMWHYAPPAIGCALANYLGNEGLDLIAALVLAGVVGYVVKVLKPLSNE